MEQTETDKMQMLAKEKGSRDDKLLLIMCLQMIIISVLFLLGPNMSIDLILKGTPYSYSSVHYILKASLVGILAILAFVLFWAAPKGSAIRSTFLRVILIGSAIVVGFILFDYLLSYIFKEIFKGVRWL